MHEEGIMGFSEVLILRLQVNLFADRDSCLFGRDNSVIFSLQCMACASAMIWLTHLSRRMQQVCHHPVWTAGPHLGAGFPGFPLRAPRSYVLTSDYISDGRELVQPSLKVLVILT